MQTRCELFVDALAVTKLNINSKQVELLCFKPRTVHHDGLGMTSTGQLVIPSDGDYRITASGVISEGAVNDFVTFGLDFLGSDGETGAGRSEDYAQTSIYCDSTGNGDYMHGCICDAAHFTAGQVIGCLYMRGSINTVNIKARCPMMTIEKIGQYRTSFLPV